LIIEWNDEDDVHSKMNEMINRFIKSSCGILTIKDSMSTSDRGKGISRE